MSRKTTSSVDPAELLAAYADGGLDAADRARVEAHFASHPEAEREVEALRRAITATRAAQPRPAQEPAWDQLNQAIRDQIGTVPTGGVRSWLQRLRPRHAVPAMVVVAAAVLLLIYTRPDTSGSSPAPLSATDELVAAAAPPPENHVDPLRGATMFELEADELDTLLAELDPADLQLEPIAETDDAPVLEPEVVADWTTADEGEVGLGFEYGVFDEPGYLDIVDDMSEDELRAVDEFLRSQTG